MEDKKISTLFEEMKGDVSNYINNKIKLVKLEAFEKGSKAGANIGYGLILAVLIFWGLFFAFITLALYLGTLLGSYVIGFAIMTGAVFLIVIIILLVKKTLSKAITNRIISQLMDNEDSK